MGAPPTDLAQAMVQIGAIVSMFSLMFFTRRASTRYLITHLVLTGTLMVLALNDTSSNTIANMLSTLSFAGLIAYCLAPTSTPREAFLPPRTYLFNFFLIFTLTVAGWVWAAVFWLWGPTTGDLEAIGLPHNAMDHRDKLVTATAPPCLVLIHIYCLLTRKVIAPAVGYTWWGWWPWPGVGPHEVVQGNHFSRWLLGVIQELCAWLETDEPEELEQLARQIGPSRENPPLEPPGPDDWLIDDVADYELKGENRRSGRPDRATAPVRHMCHSLHTARHAARRRRWDTQAAFGIKLLLAALFYALIKVATMYDLKFGELALVAWGTLRGPISVVTIDEYAKEAVANTRMDYQFLCDGDKGLNSAIKEPSNATGVGKVGHLYYCDIDANHSARVFVPEGSPWTRSVSKYDFTALPAATLKCIARELDVDVRLDVDGVPNPPALHTALVAAVSALPSIKAEELAGRVPFGCGVVVGKLRDDLNVTGLRHGHSVIGVDITLLAPLPLIIVLIFPLWVAGVIFVKIWHLVWVTENPDGIGLPRWAERQIQRLKRALEGETYGHMRDAPLGEVVRWLDSELVAEGVILDSGAGESTPNQSAAGPEYTMDGRIAVIGDGSAIVFVYPNRPISGENGRPFIIRRMSRVVAILTHAEATVFDPEQAGTNSSASILVVRRSSEPEEQRHDYAEHEWLPLPFAAGPELHRLLLKTLPRFHESLAEVADALALRARAQEFEQEERAASVVGALEIECDILTDEVPVEAIRGFNPTKSILRAEMRAGAQKGIPPGQEGDCCSICLDDFTEDGMHVQWRGCEHWFHLDCLITWARSHNTCPVCRDELMRTNVQVNSNVVSIWAVRNVEGMQEHLTAYLESVRGLITSLTGAQRNRDQDGLANAPEAQG